jgi:hypothetical protein
MTIGHLDQVLLQRRNAESVFDGELLELTLCVVSANQEVSIPCKEGTDYVPARREFPAVPENRRQPSGPATSRGCDVCAWSGGHAGHEKRTRARMLTQYLIQTSRFSSAAHYYRNY